MKIVLYLLVIAFTCWAGWYSQPGIYNWMKDRLETRKAATEAKIASAASKAKQEVENPGGKNFNAAVLDALINRTPAPPQPGTTNTSTNPSTASTTASKPAAPEPAPAPVDEIETRYPLPNFRTIEEITREWSQIPSRAFPKKIKTKVDLVFDTPAGKVNLPTGSEARAAGMVAGMLIVMRMEDENPRIEVPLANTDLKETMTTLYEQYKEYRRNMVLKERQAARDRKSRANGASEQEMALAGPKPEVRAGGVIPIMMDDILTGNYVELKAPNITNWGNLAFEEVEGTKYWTGTLQVTVENPIFGPQPTEVMALIKDNKVVKWIYTGSREPVQ